MEKHLYHGVINDRIDRPSPDIVAGFQRHDSAKVADAMARHGVMHHTIKPIAEGMRVLGPAVTVLTRPGDTLYLAHAADIAHPGDVIVVDAGGDPDVSVIGDGISHYMQSRRRIAGVVIDGAVRDVKGIRELGFPTFARGITPRLFGSQGPGAINVSISCAGVVVNPGDLILGDDDGVVVVPRTDVERVLALTDEHLAGEERRRARVEQGETLTEVQGLRVKLARWEEGG